MKAEVKKELKTIDLSQPIYATTHGQGPFHPAFHMSGRVYEWPNITFATEAEAYAHACENIGDLQKAVEAFVMDWSIHPV